eukprot:9939802-Alexandrium_andersonii.AAC.2
MQAVNASVAVDCQCQLLHMIASQTQGRIMDARALRWSSCSSVRASMPAVVLLLAPVLVAHVVMFGTVHWTHVHHTQTPGGINGIN